MVGLYRNAATLAAEYEARCRCSLAPTGLELSLVLRIGTSVRSHMYKNANPSSILRYPISLLAIPLVSLESSCNYLKLAVHEMQLTIVSLITLLAADIPAAAIPALHPRIDGCPSYAPWPIGSPWYPVCCPYSLADVSPFQTLCSKNNYHGS
jgi:hypothetical protein